ncbi:hypothetical protein BJV74DRAFT_264018 [Russula compacta]|nr:hypothetical protein BJV74DRAFT_264018 [Russula compacta]
MGDSQPGPPYPSQQRPSPGVHATPLPTQYNRMEGLQPGPVHPSHRPSPGVHAAPLPTQYDNMGSLQPGPVHPSHRPSPGVHSTPLPTQYTSVGGSQPGPVHPSQRHSTGVHSSRQSGSYTSSQPPPPPPSRQTTYPAVSAPPLTHPHTSLPSHPPAHSRHGSDTYHPDFPTPSIPGVNASTSRSGPPPSPMVQRTVTMPLPSNYNNLNAHPEAYHNYNAPAPQTTHSQSYSGMPSGVQSIAEGSNYRKNPRREYGSDFNNDAVPGPEHNQYASKGAPNNPSSGRKVLPCTLCGKYFPSAQVKQLGGFCSEEHKWQWYKNRPR